MSHSALIAEIESWLIQEALGDPEIVTLFDALCRRLHGVGVPVERAALTWPTLHPLFHAEQVFWWIEKGATLEQYPHGRGESAAFVRSPFQHILTHDLPRLRRRLAGPGAVTDFDVLREFAQQGYTDYLLTTARFRIAEFARDGNRVTGIMASWATKRQGGFTDDDIDALSRIQTIFAVTARAAIQKRVLANVVNAYLGPTAGWRVLSGDIKRGDGEVIPAVVWFSDMRASTRLSDRMAPEDYLALLNRYFECTASPVIAHGGEILNFIGDGVLGIFPIEQPDGATAAAQRATAAAREALTACAATRPQAGARIPPGVTVDFGIGLDMGELMFGNIGVPSRLAFSGIGRVVNGVQRIEKATKEMGSRVLATAAVAEAAQGEWVLAGSRRVDDFDREIELYGLAPVVAEKQAAE